MGIEARDAAIRRLFLTKIVEVNGPDGSEGGYGILYGY